MIFRTIMAMLLASPALAACPVADDLTQGIRVTAADGATEIYRDFGRDVVELTMVFEDGSVEYNLLGRGVYILEAAAVVNNKPDPDTLRTFDYPVAPAAMPVPAAGAIWRTRAVLDGVDDEKITVTWGAAAPVTYGDCTYTVIPGDIVHNGPNYRTIEGVQYFQELGFAFLASFTVEGEDDAGETTIVSISKVDRLE